MTYQSQANEDGTPMQRKTPWLRERLENGEIVVGLTITTSNLETAVSGARVGFDFLWVEMEHSPVSLEALRQIVLATSAMNVPIIARVPVVALWTAKRVLDQGVSGVIFPFVSDPDLARTAALACRYPPKGLRGSGAGLAAGTWQDSGDYYDSADSHVLTVCVIEEEGALAQIDEIASQPGIDVIFIGTSDLSFSLGLRGRQSEPALEVAIQTIADAGRRHGKFLGRPATTPEEVDAYRNRGFQFFQSVTEIGLMTLGAAQILKDVNLPAAKARSSTSY
jgi:2-keto-3-deoxy-L-rhamnonate aldolase RhmA